MKDYLVELYDKLDSLVAENEKPIIYLEAGHYDPRLGPDAFSLQSLKEAITFGESIIKKYRSDVRIVFGVLIDDLGLECGTEGCSIDAKSKPENTTPDDQLPDAIEKILASSRFIKRERLLTFSERTTKNRAINSLKKLIKSESDRIHIEAKETTQHLSFELSSGEPVLLAEQEEAIFRAKCPSIMGQHYLDCLSKIRQRFTNMTRLIVVDWSEMMDFSKVTSGSEAAYTVFVPPEDLSIMEIMNIFYMDDSGNDATFEYTTQEDACLNQAVAF